MRVILDTCIFLSDLHLSGSAFRVFLEGLGRTDNRLYVPRIVYDEPINKYSERLRRLSGKIKGAMSGLERYTGRGFESPFTEDELDDCVRDYGDSVDAKLAAADANFLDYPDVPHEQIVARALRRKKPFGESRGGYRDTLLWESVLSLATNGGAEPVAFISCNLSDFAVEEGQLHPDLCEDVDARGDQCCEIRFFDSLEGFNEEHIKPSLQELEDIRAQLQANEYPSLRLNTFIEEELVSHISSTELDPVHLGLPPNYETPSLSSVHEVQGVDVLDVRQLSPDVLLIDLLASITGELDLLLLKTQYYLIEEVETCDIWDPDWSESHMAGSVTVNVDLKLSLTFDTDAEQVTSVEIVRITRKLKPLTIAEQLREIAEAFTRSVQWSEQLREVAEAFSRSVQWSEQMKEVAEASARFLQQLKAIQDAEDTHSEDESDEPNESDDTQD